ncbi:receptor for retinol uptake stra6-like [Neolamprologus brichardi]|uniref:receptor for retinol uptake stra6-like n=1 Tax=Neolamprologus brichardi TaxID=32507 RepID=UPI001643EFFA|nr:receptor for retinol uptake stra6-like [Neolamprologus brichardi]
MNQSKEGVEPFQYSYYDYSDWYSNNAEPTKPPKEVILPCDPTADDKLFHICILSISLVIMLILAGLTRKNKFCQGFARGSSSVFSPANFLDQTQKKGVVMAVFGLVFSKLAMLVITPDPLPFSKDTPADIKEYMKIIAIFYYPILYYPLLVCGTLQRKAGYVFGTLLSFTHFGVLVWQKFDCPKTPEIYKYYALLASLPQLACLAYLCIQFPLLFVKGPKTDEIQITVKTDRKKRKNKVIFKTSSSASDKPALAERILEVIKGYIYIPEKVFRFPLKLAVSSFVTCVAIYHTALLIVVLVVPTLHIVRAGIDENIAFLLLGFGIVLSDDRMEVVRIVTFYTWLLEVCYLCAMTLSCLVSLIMLMRSMVLHSLLILRMAIQTIVFFICFLFLVFLIIIPVFYGRNIIVFEIAGKAWPAWVTLILVTGLQHVTAKFAFIKQKAGTRDLNNRESLFLLTYLLFLINTVVGLVVAIWRIVITALYNIIHLGRIDFFLTVSSMMLFRESLFLLTYLLFLINTVVGLVVAIWRIVITALYNIIHLGRIDVSLLHRTAESYDPAYCYYTHFLKVEVSQSHPVMKAFCGLLLDMMVEGGRAGQKIQDAEEACSSFMLSGIQENKPSKANSSQKIRSRWQLMYTLVNNPSLLGSRKHFQTLQNSENVLNGTPNRTSKKGSKTEASKTEASKLGAEPAEPTETPESQEKTE